MRNVQRIPLSGYSFRMKSRFLTLLLLLISCLASAYTRQDTLRGSNGRGRDWWDVKKYAIQLSLDTIKKEVSGGVTIDFETIGRSGDSMQIDLQDSLIIDEVTYHHSGTSSPESSRRGYPAVKDGNVWWIVPGHRFISGTLRITFHGKPRIARNAPWDGGLIWTKDSMANPWIAVACQGLGASAWWPCKDYQGDEPDSGVIFQLGFGEIRKPPAETTYILLTAPEKNVVGNGRRDSLRVIDPVSGEALSVIRYSTFNPINTYNTTFYYGDYVHWRDTFQGAKGVLNLDFHPLRYNEKTARKQWNVAKEMLRCFEYWMGPYPFYEDGYKLVEAPYLGMEHQSAVAYGNEYKMGYRGMDRSGTGVGMSFDYIVIHESGHEWFGNSITARDIADNWIHEGLTSYTETLFVEWIKGRKDAFRYAEGCWRNIRNDRPVIGDYGVNDEGSGDKYDKGAAVIHMIRQLMNDDGAFRQLLRGMNERFYHKIITTQEFEAYIIERTGLPLDPFFQQYLRTTNIPTLQRSIATDGILTFTWTNAHAGFMAPVRFSIDRGRHWTTVSSSEKIPYTGKRTRLERRLRLERAGLYRIEGEERTDEKKF